MAVEPLTYVVDCSTNHVVDVTEDIPVYTGQDVIFSFTPATCSQAFWSSINPALSDVTNDALLGTASTTILYSDIIFGNSFEIYHTLPTTPSATDVIYMLTFTDAGDAPAAAPEAAPLPDTGIDATALGLAAAGLLAAGVLTIVMVRRRNA
jgi:LPXTG-motif cell wall-anchored protein